MLRREDGRVSAEIADRVEQLARLAVVIDSGDLPGLVALQEQAVALAEKLVGSDLARAATLASKVGDLAESIVLRSCGDAPATFGEIGRTVQELQSQLAGAWSAPAATGPGDEDDDQEELITSWITSCEGTLSDLEGHLLALERAPKDQHAIAEIRRAVHTLKGECGVLSLHAAQQLCHEAESMIDSRLEAGQAVPIDPVLALIDWFKAFVAQLSLDRTARPEGHTRVLELIRAGGMPVEESPGHASSPGAVPDTASPAPSALAGKVNDRTPLRFAAQAGTEENLADFLCESREHLLASEEALLALDQRRDDKELINTVFRAFHTIKGVSGFMDLKPIVRLAHGAEQLLDDELAIRLPARNVMIAEKTGNDVLVPCAACFQRMKHAEKALKKDPVRWGAPGYEGKASIFHVNEFFDRPQIMKDIKGKVRKPLKGLKAVCYYGCMSQRPPAVTDSAAHENPVSMDHLLKAIGMDVVPWSYKTDCCGASLTLTRPDVVHKLSGKIFAAAKETGAECIVTDCPMCQSNLDTMETDIEAEQGAHYGLPVLYVTEMIALAFGIAPDAWWRKHFVDPAPLLKSKNLL